MVHTRHMIFNGKEWTRVCALCKQPKHPVRDFSIYSNRHNRRHRICKECIVKTVEHNMESSRICTKCNQEKSLNKSNFDYSRGWFSRICHECLKPSRAAITRKYRVKNPRKAWESKVASSAKLRSKKAKRPFDESAVKEIASQYVDGSPCPCCGKIMDSENHWASLDRIDSSRGYERGNIAFICCRCNMLKKDGTLEELEGISRYIKRMLPA